MIDHRSSANNLSSCEIKPWKKAQFVEHCTGIEEVMGSNPGFNFNNISISFFEIQIYELLYIHL